MAVSDPGFLCKIFFVIFLVFRFVCTSDQFCQEQDEILQDCSNRMEYIYVAKSQSLDVLCREIAQYLSCVHETNISCPDMPIFKDQAYTAAIRNAMNKLTRFCRGYSVAVRCTEKYVAHLVSKCTAILNKVQVDTGREDMCQYSKEYLLCLQRATEVCLNDAEFLLHNVPMAIASTESALRQVCDEVQEDEPYLSIEAGKVTPHPVCSNEIIHTEADKCTVHTMHPPEVMDVSGCRHQHRFVSCLEYLLNNCRNAGEMYQIMLRKAQETYSTLCDEFKCPKEVEDQEEDSVSYCMRDFYNVEPSATNYCKKLSLVPECIAGLSEMCPPSQDPYRVQGAVDLIHKILLENCDSSIKADNE